MRYAADNRVVRAVHDFTTGPYRWVFYAAVLAAVVFGIYFPVRDLYVAYRTGDILERQLAIREQYNETLQGDVDKLLSTDGIEEAAREDLGLVMPGEQAIDVVGRDDGAATDDTESGDDAGAAGTSDEAGGTASGESPDAGDSAAASDAASDSSGGGTASGEEGGAATGQTSKDAEGDSAANGDDASKEPTTSSEVEAAEQAAAAEAPWYIKFLDAVFFFTGTSGQRVVSSGE